MALPQHQQDVPTAPTTEPAPRDVVSWRRDQLAASGFALPLAAHVAADSRYDLHELIELVERGCEPALAIRILAPLEDGAVA